MNILIVAGFPRRQQIFGDIQTASQALIGSQTPKPNRGVRVSLTPVARQIDVAVSSMPSTTTSTTRPKAIPRVAVRVQADVGLLLTSETLRGALIQNDHLIPDCGFFL
jgi:hypothetical protein